MQQYDPEFVLSLIDLISSQEFQILLYSFAAIVWIVAILIQFRKTAYEFVIGLIDFLYWAKHVLLGSIFVVFIYFTWQELLRYFLEFYWIAPIALISFIGINRFFEWQRAANEMEEFEESKQNIESAKLFYEQLKEREKRDQEQKKLLKKPFVVVLPKSKLELEREKREKEEQLIQQQKDAAVYCLDKSFYLKKDLNQDHIEFLKKHDFVEARLTGFKPGRNTYLVAKPNGNESIKHFFLVELIAEEIRHYTNSVQTYSRDKPDIIFDSPKGKIAVEIETGNTIKKDRKRILKKIANLEKFDDFFFVVTDSEFKKLYAELVPTFTRFSIQKQIKKCFSKKAKSSCARKTKANIRRKKEKKAQRERN